MKTMLGGWDQNGLWVGERESRAEDAAPVSVSRCVSLSPKPQAKASAGQSDAADVPRLPALRRTLLAAPLPRACAEPFRQLARRQPPPLPSSWATPQRRSEAPAGSSCARLARVALDATCELSEADLVVFALPSAPPRAAAARRSATLADPVPRPRRGRQRFSRWLRSVFSRARRPR